MSTEQAGSVLIKNMIIDSIHLHRKVKVDIYEPGQLSAYPHTDILLINDGQDLITMDFASILDELFQNSLISPVICIGIHAGPERKMEYGVSGIPDFKGRGAQASDFHSFVLTELFPFLMGHFNLKELPPLSYAGFSLGGLMALDMVWCHHRYFKSAGIFSGSLWWRSVDQSDPTYNDDLHRIIHQRIKAGQFHAGQKFFFQCGNKDETNDRNNNGIIDSIDDTRDLIREFVNKGYKVPDDIAYLEMEDGSHDVPTWGKAFPEFLKWNFKKV